jgi:hypothetical protein
VDKAWISSSDDKAGFWSDCCGSVVSKAANSVSERTLVDPSTK